MDRLKLDYLGLKVMKYEMVKDIVNTVKTRLFRVERIWYTVSEDLQSNNYVKTRLFRVERPLNASLTPGGKGR